MNSHHDSEESTMETCPVCGAESPASETETATSYAGGGVYNVSTRFACGHVVDEQAGDF